MGYVPHSGGSVERDTIDGKDIVLKNGRPSYKLSFNKVLIYSALKKNQKKNN
jgi:hypothetical protein